MITYVAFCPIEGEHWLARMTRWLSPPPCSHCFAFWFDGDGWLAFEWHWSGIAVRRADNVEVGGWLAKGTAGEWWVVRHIHAGYAPSRPRLVLTCAGAVGALIGLAFPPLRPRALYRHLVRLGAVDLSHGKAIQQAGGPADRGGGAGSVGAGRAGEGQGGVGCGGG